MTDHKPLATPCSECPFARKSTPGALGDKPGVGPGTFIGQAHGPSFLPCHLRYDDKPLHSRMDLPQCAGAAIYRANTDTAKLLPAGLMELPADTELVFATPEEFLAHHGKMPLEDARKLLQIYPVEMLVHAQIRIAENLGRVMQVPKRS